MAEKKRNARGAGSIRQRKDGRWEARFVVGVDPGTGKDIRRSIYAPTQKEARRKMTEAIAALDRNDYRDPCKMTVGQWLDVWSAEYLGGVKPSTAYLYKERIRLHIKPAMSAVKLEVLTPHMIQKFYNDLGKPHGDKPGLSPKTVKSIHGILHRALQQAVAVGYIRSNPSEACILPRVKKPELHPFDEEQTKAFLTHVKGQRFEVLFTVALFTGMREGELLGLKWDCVDLDACKIVVDKQLQLEKGTKGTYVLVPTKSDKARTVTVAPWVMQLLRRHRAQQAEQRLQAGPCWSNTGYVFTNGLGDHLALHTVIKDFKKAAAAIGRPDARFHDMRHSYAVAAIRSGDDIKTVQGNLGHATAAFTLDVYGHVTDQMKAASAERMEEYIRGVLNL